MTTWITRLDVASGTGPTVAVKDAIDVAGVPTTVGCAAIADDAKPATSDATCVAALRAGAARIVGKTNLHELCFGTTGVNRWYGTPTNPLDALRVPGGSSSGSAVAVASGEADIALGTDTGGSVRIPAACCGVVGLKTTWDRIALDGVWPLAPSLDTVGPLARDVAGIVDAMRLLVGDGEFARATAPARVIGRVRRTGVDPLWESAVDHALAAAELTVVDIDLRGWDDADPAFMAIILREAWESDRALVERAPDRVDDLVATRLRRGRDVADNQLAAAREVQARWRREIYEVFDQVELLALPTLAADPALIEEGPSPTPPLSQLTGHFNLAGTPALALPIPTPTSRFASLQLVGPWAREDLLCATGAMVEAAVAQ